MDKIKEKIAGIFSTFVKFGIFAGCGAILFSVAASTVLTGGGTLIAAAVGATLCGAIGSISAADRDSALDVVGYMGKSFFMGGGGALAGSTAIGITSLIFFPAVLVGAATTGAIVGGFLGFCLGAITVGTQNDSGDSTSNAIASLAAASLVTMGAYTFTNALTHHDAPKKTALVQEFKDAGAKISKPAAYHFLNMKNAASTSRANPTA